MDRRTFTRGLLGAMAMAMVPITAIADPNQKYHTALEMFDELVDAHNQYKVAAGRGLKVTEFQTYAKLQDLIHTRLDALMEFVHTNFVIPDHNNKEAHKACAQLLRGNYDKYWRPIPDFPDLEEEFRKIPPVIMEEVWPIAMMKLVLRDYHMPINHRKLKEFKTFHDRYGYYILNDA